MPFCPQCGHECGAEERFCAKCGTALEMGARRRSRRRLAFGAILLLVVVAGIAVLVVRGGLGRVDLARAAPPDTEIWFEVDARPTPSRIAKVRPILKALEDSGLRERLAKLAEETSEEAELKVTWDEDLKPWLGFQYAVAVSGLAEGVSRGGHESLKFLGMATVRDRKTAEAVLERLTGDWAGDRDVQVRREPRDGLTIHTMEPSYPDLERRICYAFSGRVLYVSGSPEEITEAVSRMRGRGTSARDQDWYQQVRRAAPGDAVAWAAWSDRLVADGLQHHPGEDALELAGAGAAWFDVTGNGMDLGIHQLGSETYRRRFADLTRGLEGHNAWESSFGCVPKDAVGAVGLAGVSDLAELWVNWVADTRLRDDWRDAEREMDRGLGLNMQTATTDISDVCLALVSIGNPVWNTDVIVEVRGSSDEGIRDLVDHVEGGVRRSMGMWSPSSEQIEGTSCKRGDLFFGLGFWYGVRDASLVLASSKDAMAKALRARQNASERISASDGWTEARRTSGGGSLLACIISPPRLAEELEKSGVIPERELQGRARQVLGTASAAPWIVLSATLDDQGLNALLNVHVDYPKLCSGALQVVDAVDERRVDVKQIGKSMACRANFKIINTACQAYFAQNREWPSRVTDMLPTHDRRSTAPPGTMAGQLAELPVCPFDLPYALVPVRGTASSPTSPVVGMVVDWRGHWPDERWQDGDPHMSGVYGPSAAEQVPLAWPAQHDRYLTEQDLQSLSAWELDLLRNEIYARHGRPFSRSDLREHFSRRSWYRPRQNWDSAGLSPIERRNAAFILDYQRRTGRSTGQP